MKTSVFNFLIATALIIPAASPQLAGQTVTGNGTVVTRTVSITDYDEISLIGSMNFEYEQSEAAPFLSITTDENIFEHIRAEVDGRTLRIAPKTQKVRLGGLNLHPTVLKIKSNSRDLKKIGVAGSGNTTVLSPLNVRTLQIHLAGSGNITLKKDVKGDEIKISSAASGNVESQGAITADDVQIRAAGSGNISLRHSVTGKAFKLGLAGSGGVQAVGIDVQSLHCNIAGSGDIKVEGAGREATYSVAGSGNIKAYECKAGQVEASINGSGRIEVYAENELNASSMGSGVVYYKGNPASVRERSTGSGSVRQAH
jgi:hypothetical protein